MQHVATDMSSGQQCMLQGLTVAVTVCRMYATVAAGLMASGALVGTAEAASTRELQGFKGFSFSSRFDKADVDTCLLYTSPSPRD